MQEMCNEAMRIEPCPLAFILDCFKTQEICDKAIEIDPHLPCGMSLTTERRRECVLGQLRQA